MQNLLEKSLNTFDLLSDLIFQSHSQFPFTFEISFFYFSSFIAIFYHRDLRNNEIERIESNGFFNSHCTYT